MLKFSHYCCLAVLATFAASHAAAQDPPSRVARLNYIDGNVSMQPGGTQDWTPAEINRPFTTGDALYSDAASRAEFHLDSAVIRAGEYTNFAFLTLDDQRIQLSLTEGDLYINLHQLDPNQSLEVDSPNASISLLRPGVYRFRIAANGSLTFVVVRQGQAEITSGGQALNLPPGNSASLSGTGELSSTIQPAPQPDDFDLWSQDRDAREASAASLRYLPRTVVGYEDMDGYGDWHPVDGYGPVWYPRAVAVGWAPYHYGHWAWIEPWGWTWVDDAPWGFAPFHYGRWVFLAGRWGWTPGPIVVIANRPPVMRPVYAPALVAWFGGPHFGVGISIGGGSPNLGWVPLGFGEVYTPSYHCSPRYFSNVNVSNTTIVKTVNITNVYNTVYVNKTAYNQRFVNVQAPNAVTTMPQTAFASGRPVAQAGVAMQPREVQSLQQQNSAVVAPPVAPTRQALLASRATTAAVVRPPAQVSARRVIVQQTPAVAPSSFALRQPYLQQHAGETHDFATMHAQVAPQTPPSQFVRANNAPQPAARPLTEPVNAPIARRPQLATPPAAPTAPVAPHFNTPAAKAAPEPTKGYPEREHASKPAPAPKEAKKDKHADDKRKEEHHP